MRKKEKIPNRPWTEEVLKQKAFSCFINNDISAMSHRCAGYSKISKKNEFQKKRCAYCIISREIKLVQQLSSSEIDIDELVRRVLKQQKIMD